MSLHYLRAIFTAMFFIAALSAFAFADVDFDIVANDVFDDDDVIVLELDDYDFEENMIVVRERAIATLAPSSRTITASEFVGRFSDLQSVLETVSGVDIRAMGGHGQYAESAIRGASAIGVRVYLDGVLLNTASGGAVDLSKIPLDRIATIRITKSTSSLRQMGEGMGGVIEIFTLDNQEQRDIIGANVEVGSFGYIKGGAFVKLNGNTERFARLTQQFNIDASSSRNNYPFTHDNGTTIPTLRDPDPTWDDTVMRKENNFYRSIDAAYSLSIDISETQNITQQISMGAFEQGLFVYHYKDDQSGTTSGQTFLYNVDYNAQLSPRLTVGGEAGATYNGSGISDPDGRFFLGASGRELTSNTHSIFASADARYDVRENFYLAGIFGTRFQYYRQRDKSLGAGPEVTRYTYRAGGETGVALAPAEIVARVLYNYEIDSSSAGFDYWLTNGNRYVINYPVAEAIVRADLQPLTLQFSAAASRRSPTFFERFGWGSGFLSNPDLREESRIEFDVGASLNMSLWSASASVFAGRLEDKIKSIPQRNFVRVMNFADTEFYGAELDVRARPLRYLTIELGAAYLNSTITGAADPSWVGQVEPFIPEYSGFLKTEIDIKNFGIGHGIKYESECYLNIENIARRDPQFELSAWLSYAPTDYLTIRYRVDNYLNSANFDFLDNPRPRRLHVLGVSFRI